MIRLASCTELDDPLNPPVVRWLIVTARADLEYCRPGVVRDLTQSLWNALASAELNMCCWLRPLPPKASSFFEVKGCLCPRQPFFFSVAKQRGRRGRSTRRPPLPNHQGMNGVGSH